MGKIKKGFLAIGYILKLIAAYIIGHNKIFGLYQKEDLMQEIMDLYFINIYEQNIPK